MVHGFMVSLCHKGARFGEGGGMGGPAPKDNTAGLLGLLPSFDCILPSWAAGKEISSWH